MPPAFSTRPLVPARLASTSITRRIVEESKAGVRNSLLDPLGYQMTNVIGTRSRIFLLRRSVSMMKANS